MAQKGVLPPIHLVSLLHDGETGRSGHCDPLIPLEIKEQLFALFERRLWPQEIRDGEGRVWIYRRDAPPLLRTEGAQIAPRVSERDVSKLASGVVDRLINPADGKVLAGKR